MSTEHIMYNRLIGTIDDEETIRLLEAEGKTREQAQGIIELQDAMTTEDVIETDDGEED